MAAKKSSGKGFAGMDREAMLEIQRKGQEAKKRNLAIKRQKVKEAEQMRAKADELQTEAERLRQEADDIDGDYTSDKYRKRREAQLCAEIDERFRDSVSPQYLKMMKQHAILRQMTVDELVTPSMMAMDILVDPNASSKEKQDAMKALQQFENSKPIAKTDEDTDVVGSGQEELDKLKAKLAMAAPKRGD